MCIPPDTRAGGTAPAVWQAAIEYCVVRRAMLLVDSPAAWSVNPETAAARRPTGPSTRRAGGDGGAQRGALLPAGGRIRPAGRPDRPLRPLRPAIAGVFARTDAQRGVWKAPAGLDATLNGAPGLDAGPDRRRERRSSIRSAQLLRAFPGHRPRGLGRAHAARRRRSWPTNTSTFPVRRLALFIEESLYRGTQWVVFEPNDEPLWAQIRLNVGAFMHDLFRQGAFQGQTPDEAYFVKCDKETTTQNDIDTRHRQHRRRLRAAQAGRVRRHPDPADRRPDPRPNDGGVDHGPVHRQHARASIRTRTSSSASSGTAATSPASARSARSSAPPKW